MLLAGDVYGMETLDDEGPAESLVLSTVHQAKGLEWSRVFVPRLIEDSFPGARTGCAIMSGCVFWRIG